MTATWKWLDPKVVYAAHDMGLAAHGGLAGIRDQGLVESALARAPNLATYGDPDAADLVDCYAFGIGRNHGFIDGNKRTAWMCARAFLIDNGYVLRFDPAEAFTMMLSLADGTMAEADVAIWFRSRITHRP